MAEPASVVSEHAVDPFLAQLTLERLQARVRDALVSTLVALAAGLAFAAMQDGAIAFALLAGAAAGAVVCGSARSDRTALIGRLLRQRSAYAIEEVAEAGQNLVTAHARHQVARTLGELLLEADGLLPANPRYAPLYDRVAANRDDILAVAFHMARSESYVHPAAMVLATRLLQLASISPLYNESVPAADLRTALRRIQGGVTP